MIEPVRHIHAYDLSCSACGIVERFENMRFDYFLRRAQSLGWMIGTPRAARDHLCPDCVKEIPAPSHCPQASGSGTGSVPHRSAATGPDRAMRGGPLTLEGSLT